MLFSTRNHAIGMAHFQMAGGLKGLLFLLGGYVLVVGVILGLIFYNATAADLPRILLLVATLFLIMEGVGIVILGAVRVAGCIRMDVTNNMIESHRQMPVSAARAVLGYLFGTTVHIAAVIGLNILVLAGLVMYAHVSMQGFVLSQIVLLAFALFIWNFSAMGALMFRQAMPIIVLIFMFGSSGSMFLRGWGMLPGFSVLAAPFLGETIFNLGGAGAPAVHFRAAYPVALAAQAAFGTLFFIGACRRYRGSFLTTFNVPMGVALVACWGVLSAIAIDIWPTLDSPFRRDFEQPAREMQLVAGLCAAALLMIVPAHALATWEGRHPVSAMRRLLAFAGMVLAAITLLACVPFHLAMTLVTLLVLAGHACLVYAALRLLAKTAPMKTAVLMMTLLGLLWILPLILESIRWYFEEEKWRIRDHQFGLLSTFSPAGVLLSGWTQTEPPPLWIGLAFQLGVTLLLWRIMRRRVKPELHTPQTGIGAPASV